MISNPMYSNTKMISNPKMTRNPKMTLLPVRTVTSPKLKVRTALKQSSRSLTLESFYLVNQVVNEPKAYGPDDFGTGATNENEIGALLFAAYLKYNIPREGYNTILNILNDKLIPAIGNAKN
jgi:hypothetical protein